METYSKPSTGDDSGEKDCEQLIQGSQTLIKDVVEEAFRRNKDFLVHQLIVRFGSQGKDQAALTPQEDSQEWIEIDSLSKLRSLVGGRFESLKARWQGAGFPLKRKKGDKISNFQINESGWIELESWIAKQGYLARYRPDKEGCLFEISKN